MCASLTLKDRHFLPIMVFRCHPKQGHHWDPHVLRQRAGGPDGRQNLVVKERWASGENQLMAYCDGAALVILQTGQRGGRLKSASTYCLDNEWSTFSRASRGQAEDESGC